MKPTIKHVQEMVAEHFALPAASMTDKKRNTYSPTNTPRHIAMFFAREVTDHSYLTIARKFGRRDHTTARHAEQKIRRLIAENDKFAAEIKTLREAIGS
jgi:chromosomal replication initiator protein